MAAFFIDALRCGGSSVGANTSHYNRERHSVSGRWHPRCGNIADLLAGLYHGDGQAVAAGTKSATLGAAGALSVALVPTASATPANTVYSVVYQLDDAITNRQIVDEEKFKQGLSKLIDGTVDCLNASVWRKTAQ